MRDQTLPARCAVHIADRVLLCSDARRGWACISECLPASLLRVRHSIRSSRNPVLKSV